MPAFEAAGVRVYALSYDEPDALRDFAEAYGITYPLLSDPDSQVIREYGILNTLIPEDDHPWFGIPFPGSYVTDTGGRITHKFFENNLAMRVGPEQLLHAANGDSALARTPDENPGQINRGRLAPEVFVDGDRIAVCVMRDLVVRFIVPRGRHLYAAPAPGGMVAVTVGLDPHPKIVTQDVVLPSSHTHTIAATGESFEVHSGEVELRLPFTLNGMVRSERGEKEITLCGSVCWQVCDDEICDLPGNERFEITLPVLGSVVWEKIAPPGKGRVEAMNGMKHFQKMGTRRQK